MTPDEFRTAGHELVEWIATYRETVQDGPVRPPVSPGDVRAALTEQAPEHPDEFAAVLADLDATVAPGVLAVQHPMHFGWFPSNASLASVLGDMASSGLGALGLSWESAPSLTEVEEVTCDWLRQLTGLSDVWSGTITDTASVGCLTALLAARERATDHVQTRGGLASLDSSPVVYTTAQAHSSVNKAALLAGFGRDDVRVVETDEQWAMSPAALRAAIGADVAAGRLPTAVVATVGTTGTTALDPIGDIVEITSDYGVWLHVDAALAGSAMLLPECRWMWDGVEAADSLSWNPHKWLGTILDCSLFYVRDPEHLVRVMSTNPSYLRSSVDGEVTQYRDWGIPLGRRFRAMKIWFHLRLDGAEAIRARLRRDLANAAWLVEQVESTPGWELVAPVPLQTVCVRHRPETAAGVPLDGDALDAHTLAWVGAINESGDAFLTPSILDGRWMVRVSVGVEGTERNHVEAVWALMQDTAEHAP